MRLAPRAAAYRRCHGYSQVFPFPFASIRVIDDCTANFRSVQLLDLDKPLLQRLHLTPHTSCACLWRALVVVVCRYECRQGLFLLVFFGASRMLLLKSNSRDRSALLRFAAAAIVVVPLADHGVPHDGAERVYDARESLNDDVVVVIVFVVPFYADAISGRRVRSPSIYSEPWSARKESGPSGGHGGEIRVRER